MDGSGVFVAGTMKQFDRPTTKRLLGKVIRPSTEVSFRGEQQGNSNQYLAISHQRILST